MISFAMCVGATGIVFLLRPEMLIGQPRWMHSFSKIETLEKTLVRLAAVALNIHMLSAVMTWTDQTSAATMFLQVSIAVVVLLAFVLVYQLVLGASESPELAKAAGSRSRVLPVAHNVRPDERNSSHGDRDADV